MKMLITRRITISMFFIALVMLGYLSYNRLLLETIPNAELPSLYINVTSNKEVDPSYVESQVIIPIEGAISAVAGVERRESEAGTKGGRVNVTFKKNVDIKYTSLRIQEKVNELISKLPEGFSVNIERVNVSDINNKFMTLSIKGEGDVDQIRAVVDKDVKSRLESVDGIVAVNVFGGKQRTIEIEINPELSKSLNVTPATISSALRALESNRTYVGDVMDLNSKYGVHVSGEYRDISEIGNVVVAEGPLFLKDIATITSDYKDPTTINRVDGKNAITVNLTNDAGTNMIELSDRTKDEIAKINNEIAGKGVEVIIEENLADEIEANIDQISELAIVGGILAILVLWFFLHNLRIVLFIALSIPISVMSAFNVFYAFDISINVFTLIGIALAIGMLLDNSIVVLENIYRLWTRGKSAADATIQGTREVWRSIIASTLTTITVFLPFVFSDEIVVNLIGTNLGVAIISTLLFSLLVALFFIPMTTYLVLSAGKGYTSFQNKVTIHDKFIQSYMLLLKIALRKPAAIIVTTFVILGACIVIAMSSQGRDKVDVNNEKVTINLLRMPSTATLKDYDDRIKVFEMKLDSLPYKKSISSIINDKSASITLTLDKDYMNGKSLKMGDIIQGLYSKLKTREDNFDVSVTAGGASSSSMQNSMNGVAKLLQAMGVAGNDLKIVINGNDFETMKRVSAEIKNYLDQLDFIAGSYVSLPQTSEEIKFSMDPLLINSLNITRGDVEGGISALNRVTTSGATLVIDNNNYDILIKEKVINVDTLFTGNPDSKLRTEKELKATVITPASNSGSYTLEQLAKFSKDQGATSITRVNRQREIAVVYNLKETRDITKEVLDGYKDEIDVKLKEYMLPSGIAINHIREEDNTSEFEFLIFASLILIYMILASVFESFTTPFVLLFTIPLAAIGSILALILSGGSLFNVNTLTGFVILLGVVVNNGIILIDYVATLRKRGYNKLRAILESGMSRLRPIMITTITTVIALLPMAMGDQSYAGAIGSPFALTIIGGLSFSALLTLILIPTVYLSFESILKWYRSLSVKIYMIHAIIYVGALIYIFTAVDSIFIRLLYVIILTVLIPGITFFIMKSVKLADKRIIPEDEPIVIKVQNLVKIYGRPGRLFREYDSNKKVRSRLGIDNECKSIKDLKDISWKATLTGFVGYLAMGYFINSVWVTISFILFAIGLISIISRILTYIKNVKGESKLYRMVNSNYKITIIILMLVLFQISVKDGAITALYGFVILFFFIMYLLSNRAIKKDINVERINGRFSNFRRSMYKMALSIPILGKKKEPFTALKGVSFEIKTGMFGLLGPNGAGKSTFMRIISGILDQSYGTVWVNDLSTKQYRNELQALIGFLPQEFGTYENMSAWDFLDYQAILKGLKDHKVRKERVETVLKSVHMIERKDAKIGSFSGGMKQRIGIAMILLHLPRILVVDEPTAGLDPRERIRFRNLLVELSKDRIVIFSTHIIEDIASSCNQVVVINKGDVKYLGEPNDMLTIAENKVWQFKITPEQFKTIDQKLVANHMHDGNDIVVRYISKEKPFENAQPIEASLEDAYLCLLKNI